MMVQTKPDRGYFSHAEQYYHLGALLILILSFPLAMPANRCPWVRTRIIVS